MIKYKLKCESTYCTEQNEFDGWFQSIEAFENQMQSGLINCPICGDDNIIKLLATPVKYPSISGFDLEVIGFEK